MNFRKYTLKLLLIIIISVIVPPRKDNIPIVPKYTINNFDASEFVRLLFVNKPSTRPEAIAHATNVPTNIYYRMLIKTHFILIFMC